MRLPITPQLSTKDGISNKNARLTNTLKTTSATGEIAEVRPGLSVATDYTGLGNGLIVFDGRLLTMVDDTIYDDEYVDTFWPLDAGEWAAGTTYALYDAVWYDGDMWFSTVTGNTGNAPGSGGWSRWFSTEWKPDTDPAFNQRVTYEGKVYYAGRPVIGQPPSLESPHWGETPINTGDAPNAVVWGYCQTVDGVTGCSGGAVATLMDAIAWVEQARQIRHGRYYGPNPAYSGRTF